MKRAEAELRGRLAAAENLIGVLIHRVAQLAPDPGAWLKSTMTNVEDNLRGARAEAADAETKLAADFAIETFERLSLQLISANYVLAEGEDGPKS